MITTTELAEVALTLALQGRTDEAASVLIAEAEQAAARAVAREGGCSNAGVYPEVGGVVQVPGWIKVRAEEGA